MTEHAISTGAGGQSVATNDEREILAEAQVASVASPMALGFAAFALPLFVWGAIDAGFFSQATLSFLIPIALVYGGLAMVAAAMWSFRKHDGLLATVFGSFGAFWLTYGTLLWMLKANFLAFGGEQAALMGIFFLSWSIFAAYIWAASMVRGNLPMAAALLTMTATLAIAAAAYYSGSDGTLKAAGWLALITAVAAWYTSAASAINGQFNRMVLPTHASPFGTELEKIERHPGHLV